MAQAIVDQDPSLRQTLHEQVAHYLAHLESHAVPTLALRALARSPTGAGLILTLNYDRLVERTADAQGIPVVSSGVDDISALLADSLPPEDGALRVIDLHGSLDDPPDQLTLDAQSYMRRAADQDVRDLFTALLPYYNLCIIGSSFEEQYLATVLQARRPHRPRHVIVCDAPIADRILDGTAQLSVAVHNILVCDYPDGDHDVLDAFCERLVTCDERAVGGGGPAFSAEAIPEDQLYEPRTLIRRSDEDREHVEVLIALGHLKPVYEEDLREEPRALVVGEPGSGKTHLLEHFARAPRGRGRGVLVRLGDTPGTIGAAPELLASWVESGRVLDGGEPVPAAEVARGAIRVHLLVDGLDELPPSRRHAALDAILRIASALPEQRITVSSRPVPEIESFPDDWAAFDLLCDSRWRAGVLARAGVSEAEIARALGPAFNRLDPVLRVPFFLRAWLELPEQQRGATDPLDLILRLLRARLNRDPRLRPLGSHLDEWLTRLSVRMALRGQVSISHAELVRLASGLQLGDLDELVTTLETRALLHERADQYSLGHRIFAEALVGAELLKDQPERWLDVVVPRWGAHAALREDWRPVMELVLPRSDAWRQAVAKRDRHAADRATPACAPATERRAAARRLWRRAQELDIWIDPGPMRGEMTDADAIEQLIRVGGLGGITREIRRGLSERTRFRRGNAVEMLARARVRDIERILRQVLVDDDDFVVRRTAASHARRLGLRNLLEPIVRRASAPEDPSEATDMRYSRQEDWWPRNHFDDILGQLERPSRRDAVNAGFVMAALHSRSSTAADFVRHHPAAVAGLVDALDERRVEPYEIPVLLQSAGSRALHRRGARPDVVATVEAWEQAERRRKQARWTGHVP